MVLNEGGDRLPALLNKRLNNLVLTTNIEYRVKESYGNKLIYIVDERVAAIVRRLTGQKTLTQANMSALMEWGFTFTQVL